VLNGLIFATDAGRSGSLYAIFQAIAFLCAMVNSYILNRNWTFSRVPGKSQVLESGEFLLISVLGAGVNVGSAWYVATYVQPARPLVAYWPSVAALVGTAFSLGFNFIGYKYFVFSSRVHSRA
jgi:putative flippase GtrA